MRKKVQVWIVARTKTGEPRFLLLKTNRKRGGFWQPVTGSVDPGETLTEAALREAREESGLRFKARPRALRYAFTFKSQWGGLAHESVFSLEAPKGALEARLKLDPREHVKARWVRADEALKLLKFETNAKPLRILCARLLRRG